MGVEREKESTEASRARRRLEYAKKLRVYERGWVKIRSCTIFQMNILNT